MATKVASAKHKIAHILPATPYEVKRFQVIATQLAFGLALVEIDLLEKNAAYQKNLGVRKAVTGAALQESNDAFGQSVLSFAEHDSPKAKTHREVHVG